MAEKTTVTFKVDKDVKDQATEIFSSLGMNFTTGLDVYLRAVIRTGGVPFSLIDEPPARMMSLADRAAGAKEVSDDMTHDAPEHNFDRDARYDVTR